MTHPAAKQHSPCVSVIIPTYNRRNLLQRAIDSALQQTVQDIEVIIADDGSTDGTAELFSTPQDPRIRYCQLPHGGACAARNAGIDLARGRYIAFLDSDDVWRTDKLAVQQKQLEATDADVVFCAFMRHDLCSNTSSRFPAEDVTPGRVNHLRLLSGNLVSTQTIFGKAECMKHLRFDEQFPRMQDWEYAIRLAQSFRLYYFADILADVYLQTDSISGKPALGLKATRLLYSKYRPCYETSPEATRVILGAMHHYAQQCAQCCLMDYLRALSPRRGLIGCIRLAAYCAPRCAKELLLMIKNRRKSHL